MIKRKKIVVIAPAMYAYVQNDIIMLSAYFDVQTFIIKAKPNVSFIKISISAVTYLFRHVADIQGVLFWFVDYHASLPFFISKFLRLPVLSIAGGYDTVLLPEIGYGAHNSWLRSKLIQYIFRQSTHTIAVSNYLKHKLETSHRVATKQIRCIPNVTATFFYSIRKNNIWSKKRSYTGICVSNVQCLRSFKVKGVDRLYALARANPSQRFLWIGVHQASMSILPTPPPNLDVISFCSQSDLAAYYLNSVYVLQLSRFESFGIAVLEGILCGCVPVVSAFTGCAELASMHPLGVSIEDFTVPYHFDASDGLWSEVHQDILFKSILEFRSQYSIEKRKELFFQLLCS